MKVRKAAVAGSFYPGSADKIRKLVEELRRKELPYIDLSLAGKNIIGAVVPHAGYVYSGYEAVHVFEILRQNGNRFDTVIIVNPNHHGLGPPVAADEHDAWETPLGRVPLDAELAGLTDIPKADASHRFEHSAEVILPFLQLFLAGEFSIFPVSMINQDPQQSRDLAESITRAVQRSGRRILLIASSDFSHFVHPRAGAETDLAMIRAIESMQPDAVYRQIRRTHASVCGYGPIMTLMHYAVLNHDHPAATLLKFGNSAKKRPSDSVVDYASVLFYQ